MKWWWWYSCRCVLTSLSVSSPCSMHAATATLSPLSNCSFNFLFSLSLSGLASISDEIRACCCCCNAVVIKLGSAGPRPYLVLQVWGWALYVPWALWPRTRRREETALETLILAWAILYMGFAIVVVYSFCSSLLLQVFVLVSQRSGGGRRHYYSQPASGE